MRIKIYQKHKPFHDSNPIKNRSRSLFGQPVQALNKTRHDENVENITQCLTQCLRFKDIQVFLSQS